MKVTFLNHNPTPKEIAAYRAHAMQSQPTAEEVLVDFDGDDAMLTYSDPAMEAVAAYEDAWDYPAPEQQKRYSGLLEESE